jgi:Zn-dependent protease/CBS domain-containing protein
MLRQRGFQIGRIFGINIQIDWSWFLIFALISWNLSSFFGQTHPDWGNVLRWGIALGAALLFFASVLAHELAHSLMARAYGVPVRNITLMLFGGVANIQREPPSPKAEFLITIVGPVISVLLGLFFLMMAAISMGPVNFDSTTGLTAVTAQLGPVITLLLWLGPINIVLGLFNLIPGFPLDGGRILRSILWAGTNNLRRATRWAAGVGQAVAWLMIIAGIAMIFGAQIPFFGTGFVSGIWLAFIGWFLNSAAVQSYQQVVVEDMLEGIRTEQIMRQNPPTAPANISVHDLVHNYVMGTDDHAFPVQENGQMLGLVTLEDVRAVPREQWDTTFVRDIMTPGDRLATIETTAEADEALHTLKRYDVRQLPVLQNGRLVGILRRRDILKWLQLQGT